MRWHGEILWPVIGEYKMLDSRTRLVDREGGFLIQEEESHMFPTVFLSFEAARTLCNLLKDGVE